MKLVLRILGALLLVLAAVGGGGLIKPWQASSSPSLASASGSAKGGPPLTIADGFKLQGRGVDATVNAVGTLLPNESVSVASEVTRRVVKISFEDGAVVKQGDVLFELDSADLSSRMSELAVRRKLLAINEQRQKRLSTEGLSPQAEYDRARSELELLDAQSQSLAVEIAKTKIKAPFGGTVGLRNVSVGALVSPGTSLVSLQDTSVIKLDFTVPERYAPTVKQGGRFSFRVDGSAKTFEGTVRAVEPAVDQGTRSLKVRGVADTTAPELVPGGFATVSIILSTQAGGLFVPSVAVIPSVGGHAVYRFEDGVAKLVEVELGIRTDTEVQITKGLAEGDVVLVSNLLRLRPGAKVKLAKDGE